MSLSKRAGSDIPEKDLPPIFGLKSIRLATLAEATEGLESKILGLDEQVKWAQEKCKYPSPHGLTRDQSAAIFLYTMEGTLDSLYDVLNRALRQRQRAILAPWLLFLKLFVIALEKCPTRTCNVWRGVKGDQRRLFSRGETFTWWSITSCSTRVSELRNFLSADGTLFMIEAVQGRDVSLYSAIPGEEEIILAPGTKFTVMDNSLEHETGLHVVHLKELSANGSQTHNETQPAKQASVPPPSSNTGVVRRRINLPQGGHYEGDVDSNGVYQGYGLLVDAEGILYQGHFHQGKFHGRGVMEWPNGQRYDGEFQNGCRHGEGTLRYANRHVVVGRWQNDEFCDAGAYFD